MSDRLRMWMLATGDGSAVVAAHSADEAEQVFVNTDGGSSEEVVHVDEIGWDGGPAWLASHYTRTEEIAEAARASAQPELAKRITEQRAEIARLHALVEELSKKPDQAAMQRLRDANAGLRSGLTQSKFKGKRFEGAAHRLAGVLKARMRDDERLQQPFDEDASEALSAYAEACRAVATPEVGSVVTGAVSIDVEAQRGRSADEIKSLLTGELDGLKRDLLKRLKAAL